MKSSNGSCTLRFLALGSFLSISVTLLLVAWSALIVQRVSRAERQVQQPPLKQNHCILKKKKHPGAAASCTVGFVLQGGVCIPCPRGKFALGNWVACQSLLDCDEVNHETTKGELLHTTVHWQYYRAEWKGYEIIYATFDTLAESAIDYATIQLFSPSSNFLYPVGFCEERSVVLFASNSTLMEVGSHFAAAFDRHPQCNNCRVRLHMATSYAEILTRLHAANTTLCNSHTLPQLLSQFLITEDFSFILATLDNLPRDTTGPILCQWRELRGSFVAPEQNWPHGAIKIFNSDDQPKYTRLADVWKVPDVVSAVLSSACRDVLDYLYRIHVKCKDFDPRRRPTAAELLKEYRYVWDLLYSEPNFH